MVLIYNTRLLAPEQLTGWQDLFRPELRGRIAFADPGVSGSSFTGLVTMLHALGGDREDAVRRFAGALDGRQLEGSGDVLTAVSGGGCWAGITLEETALKRVDAGDSIALVYPKEGTSLVPDGSAWCGTPPTQTMPGPFWTLPPAMTHSAFWPGSTAALSAPTSPPRTAFPACPT